MGQQRLFLDLDYDFKNWMWTNIFSPGVKSALGVLVVEYVERTPFVLWPHLPISFSKKDSNITEIDLRCST